MPTDRNTRSRRRQPKKQVDPPRDEDDAADDVEDKMMAQDVEEPEEVEDRVIQHEHRVWKRHMPLLYDLFVPHCLDWPSLTVQWLPTVEEYDGRDYVTQDVLLGTNTSSLEPDYICIATVQLPRGDMDDNARKFDDERGEIAGYGAVEGKVSVKQRIPHHGEINRARYMPQRSMMIATKTVSGDVHLYDRSKFPSQPNPNNLDYTPTLRLSGHSEEGYGLSWSTVTEGHLLSSSQDATICHWDIHAPPTEPPAKRSRKSAAGRTHMTSSVCPLRVYRGHSSVVGDVSWCDHEADTFASVGDDRQLLVWDARRPEAPGQAKPRAHTHAINAVAFHAHVPHLLATGGSDHTVRVWDRRQMARPTHTFSGAHVADVTHVSWSPHHADVLMSAGADRRVMVWDLNAGAGESDASAATANGLKMEEQECDAIPELMFIHGGHSDRVSDAAWNPVMPWVVVSASEDNALQVWQMAGLLRSGVAGTAADAAPGSTE
ncbi:Chromatin assembly complex, subunit 3 [Allomyces arbusculus]|nr:Chromatin assembly complex, subunit 3 [Allomyces arbusculus]